MRGQETEWSDNLKERTRRALENFDFSSRGNVVCFKHVKSGVGVIAIDDLLRGNLKMVDPDTKQEMTFANADELIHRGWAID